jgi:hypothetical protein
MGFTNSRVLRRRQAVVHFPLSNLGVHLKIRDSPNIFLVPLVSPLCARKGLRVKKSRELTIPNTVSNYKFGIRLNFSN